MIFARRAQVQSAGVRVQQSCRHSASCGHTVGMTYGIYSQYQDIADRSCMARRSVYRAGELGTSPATSPKRARPPMPSGTQQGPKSKGTQRR